MPPLLRSLRIRQWTKNVVVFIGLAYSGHALEHSYLHSSLLTFVAFCLASSAVYLINDVVDRERDRNHPSKCLRPIASGEVSVKMAIGLAVLLAASALFITCELGEASKAIVIYFGLQVLYSTWLKHVYLVDVFCIAAGFSLRVLAGVWAIEIPVSPWLVACTVQLALFLALCKRRAEVSALTDKSDPASQRPTLAIYNSPATDLMVVIMAAAVLLTYTLYTLLPASVIAAGNPELMSKAGMTGMVATLPFVYFGVMRYLHLVYSKGGGERPERLATMDLQLIGCALGFAATAGYLIYFK
jgi:4-hydroxybenzoate polyprenyltransferase